MSHEETAIDPGPYCREIEAYLCRKNGGHLVRVVGPAFGLVVDWARQGIPLKVVMRGIDRRVERQAAGRSAGRPLRIEFCEADVIDVFREWRRAVGVGMHAGVAAEARADLDHRGAVPGFVAESSDGAGDERSGGLNADQVPSPESAPVSARAGIVADSRRSPSLPRHLRRVIDRLALIPEDGRRPRELDAWLAQAVQELGRLEVEAPHLRGAERAAALEQLRALDLELLARARSVAAAEVLDACAQQARIELQPFASRLVPAALAQSLEQATLRHLREAFKLPVIALE